jgi:hypothetical protein
VGKEGSMEVCILRRELIEREKFKPRASNRKLLDHPSKGDTDLELIILATDTV